MKIQWSQILVMVWICVLILGVCASCGHGQEKGEENEAQSNLEKADTVEYEISHTGSGTIEESKEEATVDESSEADDSKTAENGTTTIEYWAGEASAVVYFDDDPEKSQNQGESGGDESENEAEVKEAKQKEDAVTEPKKEEEIGEEESKTESKIEMKAESQTEQEEAQPYYLSEADRAEVIGRLVEMGESYGMKYYPNITEGETWDSPTPIYVEELFLGRDHVINAMVEYTEGAFVLMQMEGCPGFALQIKEHPNTVTDAYYEVYVYWI